MPEMIKGIYGKPVADLKTVVMDPGNQLGKAVSFCLPSQGLAGRKTFSDGSGQRIDTGDAALWIKRPQLVYGKLCGLEGSRQPRGKAKIQDIFAFLKRRLKILPVDRRRDLGGEAKITCSLQTVKFRRSNGSGRAIGVSPSPDFHMHRNDLYRREP